MGLFILFGLLFVGLLIGLTYLLYFIPKKLGYPKTGKILSFLFGLFLVTITLMSIFEDELFTKGDAEKLLVEQKIVLTDKFEIDENKSMWAIGDYYHTFTLTISANDKQIIINQITNSPDFKGLLEPKDDLLHSSDRYEGPKITQNYEEDNYFVREYFESNGQGYAPTFRRILVFKRENKLTFEDIDE